MRSQCLKRVFDRNLYIYHRRGMTLKTATCRPRRLVTYVIDGKATGGVKNSVGIISRYFPYKAHLKFVSLSKGALYAALVDAGADPALLGDKPWRIIQQQIKFGRVLSVFCLFHNFVWILQRALVLKNYLERNPTKIVHVNAGYDLLVGVITKQWAPFQLVCHWRGIGINRMGINYIAKWINKNVDRYIAISNAVKQSLPIEWQKKTKTIYNAADIDAIAEKSFKRQDELKVLANIQADEPVIYSLGTYAEHKGQHLLLEALKFLVDLKMNFTCTFVGQTPNPLSERYYEQLIKRAEDYNLSKYCRFLRDIHEPGALFPSAGISVITTHGIGEGFGLVFVEAMACRSPIIAFDTGAAAEIVEHNKTGILVPDKDTKALAQAIASLLLDVEKRKAFGTAGYLKAKRSFDAHRIGNELCKFYNEI